MKHLDINTGFQCNRGIELTAARMALEADVLGDFTHLLSVAIPNLANNLSQSFTKSFAAVTGFVSSLAPDNRLNSKISQIPYSELAGVRGYVPEGFSGSAADYVKVLDESWEHASKVISEVLNPYNAYVSGLLSNVEATKSTEKKPEFLTRMDRDRDDLNKEIGRFFKGSTGTSDKLSKFYRRSQEVVDVKIGLERLLSRLAEPNVDLVQKNTRDTLELVNALIASNKTEELKQISPQCIRALAEATLTVAKEVEFYAITRYRVEGFAKCFEDTLEIIKKLD